MDIQRINIVLNRAIIQFQNSEIEVVSEAAIGGFKVPSPGSLGFQSKSSPKAFKPSFKVKSPKELGYKPFKPSKWKRGKFSVRRGKFSVRTGEGVEREEVSGPIKGVWGIAQGQGKGFGKIKRGWTIYHIPSGYQVRSLDTQAGAKMVIDIMEEEEPHMVSMKSRDELVRIGSKVFDGFIGKAKWLEHDKKSEREENKRMRDLETRFSEPTKMASLDKWTKGAFELSLSPEYFKKGEKSSEKVSGYMKGVWGVRRDGGSWSVTHIPSGMMLKGGIKKKANAMALVDAIGREKLELMREKDDKKIVARSNFRIFKRLFREYVPEAW